MIASVPMGRDIRQRQPRTALITPARYTRALAQAIEKFRVKLVAYLAKSQQARLQANENSFPLPFPSFTERLLHGRFRASASVSKTGMGGSVHRGFESLPLRFVMSRDRGLG